MGYAPPCFTVTLLLTNFVRHTHLDSLPKCVEEKFSEKGACLGSPPVGKEPSQMHDAGWSPSIRTPSGVFTVVTRRWPVLKPGNTALPLSTAARRRGVLRTSP